MSLKIAVFGAGGRLGRSICNLARISHMHSCEGGQDVETDFAVREEVNIAQHLADERDAKDGRQVVQIHPVSCEKCGLVSDPFVLSPEPDVYIDASLPPGVPSHLEIALRAKRPIVIGVTALSDEVHALLADASRSIPVFYSPNFSLGTALLKKFAELMARSFHQNADIDLIETHHIQKKDAPSGTALNLAAAIGKKVNIHSIRSGQIVGTHELIFNTAEEQITLAHTSHSRDAFARGALAAAAFLAKQPPGLYGMDDLLR